jgi:hypothetical protein
MIHQAQEGTPISDILLGLAVALVRNYASTLIKGDTPAPLVSLQGGVMSNQAGPNSGPATLQGAGSARLRGVGFPAAVQARTYFRTSEKHG